METQDGVSVQGDSLARITDGLPPNTVSMELHRSFMLLNEASITRTAGSRMGRRAHIDDVQRILNGDAQTHLQRAISDPATGGPALVEAVQHAKSSQNVRPAPSRPRPN